MPYIDPSKCVFKDETDQEYVEQRKMVTSGSGSRSRSDIIKKILRILKSLDSRWSLDYDDDGDDDDGDHDDDGDDGDDASFSGSYQVSGWAVNGRELAATGTNRSFLHDGDHHDRDQYDKHVL